MPFDVADGCKLMQTYEFPGWLYKTYFTAEYGCFLKTNRSGPEDVQTYQQDGKNEEDVGDGGVIYEKEILDADADVEEAESGEFISPNLTDNKTAESKGMAPIIVNLSQLIDRTGNDIGLDTVGR